MVPAASGSLQIKLGWVGTKREPFAKKDRFIDCHRPIRKGKWLLRRRIRAGQTPLSSIRKIKDSSGFSVFHYQQNQTHSGPAEVLHVVILFLACFLLCCPDCCAFKVKLNGKRAKGLQAHHSPGPSSLTFEAASLFFFLFFSSPFHVHYLVGGSWRVSCTLKRLLLLLK